MTWTNTLCSSTTQLDGKTFSRTNKHERFFIVLLQLCSPDAGNQQSTSASCNAALARLWSPPSHIPQSRLKDGQVDRLCQDWEEEEEEEGGSVMLASGKSGGAGGLGGVGAGVGGGSMGSVLGTRHLCWSFNRSTRVLCKGQAASGHSGCGDEDLRPPWTPTEQPPPPTHPPSPPSATPR